MASMMFLLFSGLVLLNLEVGHNVEGDLAMGCKGGNCHNSFSITPDVSRPTSCLDYLLKGESNCGIYRLYDNVGNSFPAYCDLNSEPGTAWTLVMSWSWGTQYRSLAAFKRTPLKFDAPVNEYAINWDVYRLSLARMRSLQSHSTHWRATCSYPTHGVDFTDYVRGTFSDLNIIDYSDAQRCKKVEYINIRGHIGIHETVPFWQGTNANSPFLYIHSAVTTTCHFQPTPGSVPNENNFGWYGNSVNLKFRCTQGSNSSTQWWFGAHF
ncbi:uncharacterized protein [Montipora capricornis]|uniref:uncharacterized protein n=1 Tax=Montipora capricornis TaxID=246305 RepID=UPI0035F1166C